MRAGDTFYVRDRGVDTHLWIVISDTDIDPEHVLLVNMTTYEDYKEDVCLLDVGDHPRIIRKSCIAYHEARMTTLEELKLLVDGGRLSIQAPVSEEVLARIRIGISRSRRIKYRYIEILLEQAVIE